MTELNFDSVKSVIIDILNEHNFGSNYKINKQEQDFTGDNYLSKIVNVQIVDEENDKKQLNLLLKLNNISEAGRSSFPAEKFYARESHGYKNVFPALLKYQQDHSVPEDERFKFAKFYKNGEEYLKEYIIFEDLTAKGYHLYGKDKSLDYEHSKVVLRTLANYHATSFAMKANDPSKFSKLKENISAKNNYPDIIYSMISNLTEKILPYLKCDKRKQAINSLIEKQHNAFEDCLDSKSTEPYNVICHGDLWNNNMLFRREGDKLDVIFVDYQFMRYASPATDIVYNFYMSTEKSFRDEYFIKLCDEYYDALGENLRYYGCDVKEIYPREVLDKQLKYYIPFGILFGFISCTLLLNKTGEEVKLEEMIGDGMSDVSFSATDLMMKRLEGLADDIIKYNIHV